MPLPSRQSTTSGATSRPSVRPRPRGSRAVLVGARRGGNGDHPLVAVGPKQRPLDSSSDGREWPRELGVPDVLGELMEHRDRPAAGTSLQSGVRKGSVLMLSTSGVEAAEPS